MSYQRVRQEQPPEDSERPSSECMAYGCPLPATFSTRPTGKNFLCRAHDGTEAHDWPAITERVKRIERAFFAAFDLTNASAGDKPDPHIVSKFVALSSELAVAGNPTARTYGSFVVGKLLEKVRPKYVAPVIPALNLEPLRRVDIQL